MCIHVIILSEMLREKYEGIQCIPLDTLFLPLEGRKIWVEVEEKKRTEGKPS